MKLLLDTHLLVWLAEDSPRLSAEARELVTDPSLVVVFSVASLWEVSIKFALGRSAFDMDPQVLRRGLLDHGFVELPLSAEHVIATVALPPIHRDPFDRILVAQATVEGLILLTADATIARYPGPIRRI